MHLTSVQSSQPTHSVPESLALGQLTNPAVHPSHQIEKFRDRDTFLIKIHAFHSLALLVHQCTNIDKKAPTQEWMAQSEMTAYESNIVKRTPCPNIILFRN